MKTLHIFLLAIILLSSDISTLFAQDVVRIAFPISPPWRIVTDGKIDGVDGRLMTALAQKLNAEIEFEVVPFKRSLKEIEMGGFDMMSGLLFRPAREDFLDYIKPAYKQRSNKSFYVQKGKGHSIKQYEDLMHLRIGLRLGVKYFPRFDQDTLLKKSPVRENELNIAKLLKGRIDTFIISGAVGDYLIKQAGVAEQLEKTEFGYSKENPVYIGISKKSPWSKRHHEISALFAEMSNNGEIDRLIKGYFIDNGMPIPQYK